MQFPEKVKILQKKKEFYLHFRAGRTILESQKLCGSAFISTFHRS